MLVPLDPRPVNALEQRRDLGIGWTPRRPPLEVPCLTQHTGRQVETSLAQRVAAVGIAQQRNGLGVDRHCVAASAPIDRRRDARVAIARVFRLDAQHVGNRCTRGAIGLCAVLRANVDCMLRRHCDERIAVRLRQGRRGHQKRFSRPNSIQRAENSSRPGLPPPPARQPAR